ncbi:MAG: hypothetical protein ACQKBY_10625 [Verrucomicrobiales bacterium]
MKRIIGIPIKDLLMVMISLLLGASLASLACRFWSSSKPCSDVFESELKPPAAQLRAEGIVVPIVDFDAAPLSDVVDFLRAMSRSSVESANAMPSDRLNFIIFDHEAKARPVSLYMREVRLDHLVERVAEAAGARVSYASDAIIFRVGD